MIELCARIAAAALLTAGTGLAAFGVAVRIDGRAPSLRRWIATIAASPVVMTFTFHALAPFGAFRLLPVLSVVALLAALATRLLGGVSAVRSLLRREVRFLGRSARLVASRPGRGASAAFFVCASPILLRAVVAPPLGWDTFTYHALKAGMWVQGGGLDAMEGTGPWGYYRDMLGGGDIPFAWSLLSMHGDGLTGIFGVFQWLALGLCLVGLSRELGSRGRWPATIAGFLLALPTVRLVVGSAYVEIGLLLSFTAGLTLALRARRHTPALAVLLSAASLGVAGAHKLPMVVIAGATLVVALGAAWRRSRRTGLTTAALLLFCLPAAAFFAVSYVRNGTPLAPLPVRFLGLAAGEASPEVHWYMDRPELADIAYRVGPELEVLAHIFGAPGDLSGGLGPFAFVSMLTGLLLVWRLRPEAAGICIAAAAATFACFYAPGFSMVRHYWSVSSGRFLLPAVAVLAITGARVVSGTGLARPYMRLLLAGTFFQLLQTARHGIGAASEEAIFWLIALVGATATIVAFVGRALPPPQRGWAVSVPILGAILGFLALKELYRDRILAEDFAIHFTPAYWAEAASIVDDPTEPRVVAVTSGPERNLDNWFASPFLGRRLQNRLVNLPLAADGIRRRWGAGGANDEIRRTADYAAWRRSIAASGVTDVMSFKPPSVELSFMEAHPGEFQRRAGVPGEWGLFRVRRQR